jgi:hypothetical protein
VRDCASARSPSWGRDNSHTQNAPVAVDLPQHYVLDPIALDRNRAGGRAAPGYDPGGGQITLLPEVGPQHPDIEVVALHTPQPPLPYPERRINRDCLPVLGRRARAYAAGIDPILPEERSNSDPVTVGNTLGVTIEELVDRILIPSRSGWGTVLYPASGSCQDADVENRQMQTAQTARWYVSRT